MSSGFVGFRARIDMISAAFGAGTWARQAISDEFKMMLQTHQQSLRPVGDYTSPDWTAATEADFDTIGQRAESMFRHIPNEPVLAIASWHGCEIELREMRADLVGGEFRAVLALVSDMSVYDTRARGYVTKWSPFLTDTACVLSNGSKYSTANGPKSVSVLSTTAASASLRKLIERHFKVSFTNTPNP